MRPISRPALGAATAAVPAVTAIAPSVATPPDERDADRPLTGTWHAATTAQQGGRWTATVDHADAAGRTVTLRTELTDAHGNSVVQTVNDAYAVR